MKELNNSDIKYALGILFEAHRKEVLNDLDDHVRLEVINQKTRFQKFWCWFMYGHIFENDVCLRCGKIKTK